MQWFAVLLGSTFQVTNPCVSMQICVYIARHECSKTFGGNQRSRRSSAFANAGLHAAVKLHVHEYACMHTLTYSKYLYYYYQVIVVIITSMHNSMSMSMSTSMSTSMSISLSISITISISISTIRIMSLPFICVACHCRYFYVSQ